MRRTLIVTNDFPPRRGGIQSFVHALALRLDPGKLTVYAPRWDGAREFDAAQPFEVVRHPTSLMIGGPAVTRRAVRARQVQGSGGRHLRRRRAAGADHPRAAPRGHRARDRDHPRPRGRLGRAARRQEPAAPHRRRDRRRHVPGRVLPGPAGAGALARRGRPHGPAAPGRGRDPVPPGPGGTRHSQGPLRARRPPRRRLRLQAGPQEGPGHAAHSVARGAEEGPRRIPADRRFRSALGCSPSVVRTYRADSERPLHRSGAGRRASRALRGRATSSRCRAGPGAAASTWKASASSTWRRPRPACRSSAATRAAPRTRSSRARRATWSRGRDIRPWRTADRPPARPLATAQAMGDKGRAWVERDWSWDLTAARLRSLIDGSRPPGSRQSLPGRLLRSTAPRCRWRTPWPAPTGGCPAWRTAAPAPG